MPSLGNLSHKKHSMEVKPICDFPALYDFFFLIQAFSKYLLSTYNHSPNSRHQTYGFIYMLMDPT